MRRFAVLILVVALGISATLTRAQDPLPTVTPFPTQTPLPTSTGQPTTAATSIPLTATPTPTDAPQVTYNLPISADVSYVIRPGDNLDSIAALFDVDRECLREGNGITPTQIIYPDETLTISVDCPPYSGAAIVEFPRESARTPGDGTYVVARGDTLDTIAQDLDVSLQSLIAANPEVENFRRLGIGDVLQIPQDAPPYGEVGALTPEPNLVGALAANTDDEAGDYVVQPGDTLDTIAQELDISLAALQEANGIRDGRTLRAGQTLVIPSDAPPYGAFPALTNAENLQARSAAAAGDETYVIQLGDTLDEIAQQFNVSVESLRLTNDISTLSDVQPGREIIIPADAQPYQVFPASGTPAGSTVAAGEEYVIQPGDVLDIVAANYNVDTLCLIERNGIENTLTILPGQVIGIPSDCPEYGGGYVVPGRAAPTQGAQSAAGSATPIPSRTPDPRTFPTPVDVTASPVPTLDATSTPLPTPTEEAVG